jgi:hypothetical protein
MPSVVLLDATPLAGTGCDRSDRTYVRGLIGDFRHHPEPERRRLLHAASLGAAGRVRITAGVDDARPAELRSGATLAAMAAGLPVRDSEIPELGEQLRAVGARASGFAADRWAEALDGVLEDASARAGLVVSSHPRARAVLWAETVRQAKACVAEARDG